VNTIQGRLVVCGSILVGFQTVGCAARSVAVGSSLQAADTSLFAAVVRVIGDSSKLPLVVDPRPLRAEPPVDVTGPGTWADVLPAVLIERRYSLDRLAVRSGSADIPSGCASTQTPDPSGTERRGCPKQLALVAAVGLPRGSSEFAPAGLSAYAAVRVPEMTVGPGGWSVSSYEYIMQRDPNGWRLVMRRAVMFTE
jgi:hypothetical protein